MAADSRLLQGELDSEILWTEGDVERLMIGFTHALMREQRPNGGKAESKEVSPSQTKPSKQEVSNEL